MKTILRAISLAAALLPGVALTQTKGVVGAQGDTGTTTGELASQSDIFQRSIGVNFHTSYTNTNYSTNFTAALAKLQKAQITWIRDGFYLRTATDPITVNQLAMINAGININMMVSPNGSTLWTAAQIQQMAAITPFASLEGPNECDVNSYGCATALTQLAQSRIAATALGIKLNGISVTGTAGIAAVGSIPAADYNAIHAYLGGREPENTGFGGSYGDLYGYSYGAMMWWNDQVKGANAINKRSVVTETGYPNYAPGATNPAQPTYTLDEATYASYLPRTLLYNFSMGIHRTFVYEFLDQGVPNCGVTTGNCNELNYGLIRQDMSEKPAFVALTNLSTITADRGAAFNPGRLSYTLPDASVTYLKHLLLQKRDGTFLMFVWLRSASWNPATLAAQSVGPVSSTLTLKGTQRIVSVTQFDNTGAVTTSTASAGASTLTRSFTDQVTVIAIK